MREAMVDDDAQALGRLPLRAETERRLVLEKFNDTQVDYPRDCCIQDLIEQQVRRTPDAIAVEYEGEQLRFDQLNAADNRLAHHLRGLGVKPDDRVTVSVDSSMAMVVALRAVMNARAAYVTLEPNYIDDELGFIPGDIIQFLYLPQQARSRNTEA